MKVFLFKDGHRRKYRELDASAPIGYERERFHELGLRSLPFLERELRLAKPRLVVTLGMEVAGVLTGRRSARAQRLLVAPKVVALHAGRSSFPAMHCAHPGILMRGPGTSNWPATHLEEFIPALREAWRA